MLEYNEITLRKYILLEGEPYEVLDSHVFRMQQRKPQNKTKLKNLLTGRVVEQTFHQSEKVEEAEIDTKDIKYLYTNKNEAWFCDLDNPANRFTISAAILDNQLKYIKLNSTVKALVFDEKVMGLEIPVKVELLVTDAPPAVRGDTAKGGNKQVTLETGLIINAPMFITEGDVLRINTQTGDYVERA